MAYVPPHRRPQASAGAARAPERAAAHGARRGGHTDGSHSKDNASGQRDARASTHHVTTPSNHSDAYIGNLNATVPPREMRKPRHGGTQDMRNQVRDPHGSPHEHRAGDAHGGRIHHERTGSRPKGAPSRFGSIGRPMSGALREGEDVRGGRRVDPDGMVYEMNDGSVRFFQDRGRKYPFTAGAEALPLLRGLLRANERVFAIAKERVEATGNARSIMAEGEALYADKPTMKQHHGAKGTWSDDEYAHPGLQSVYLRLKSFQRFTESWALLERAAESGLLDGLLSRTDDRMAVASLGGGPGYELLACDWFLRYWTSTRNASEDEKRAWLREHDFTNMQVHRIKIPSETRLTRDPGA